MGYPMSYRRIVRRHAAWGTYEKDASGRTWDQFEALVPSEMRRDWTTVRTMFFSQRNLAGDLRRLEDDQRDANHLSYYAMKTGLLEKEVKAVLDLFFAGPN